MKVRVQCTPASGSGTWIRALPAMMMPTTAPMMSSTQLLRNSDCSRDHGRGLDATRGRIARGWMQAEGAWAAGPKRGAGTRRQLRRASPSAAWQVSAPARGPACSAPLPLPSVLTRGQEIAI